MAATTHERQRTGGTQRKSITSGPDRLPSPLAASPPLPSRRLNQPPTLLVGAVYFNQFMKEVPSFTTHSGKTRLEVYKAENPNPQPSPKPDDQQDVSVTKHPVQKLDKGTLSENDQKIVQKATKSLEESNDRRLGNK